MVSGSSTGRHLRAGRPWAAATLLAISASAGCAHVGGGGFSWPAPAPDTDAGWRALLDGHSDAARTAFDRRLAADGTDALAAFGRGTISFERGDRPAAVADYARLVTVAADQGRDSIGALLAPVAAGRLVTMLQDVPDVVEQRADEDQALAARRGSLPWAAQVELGRLGDRVSRRRGDRALMDRLAELAGCARTVFQTGQGGRLPHIDLDSDTSTPSPAAWRAVAAAGCRLQVASWDGRSGVQIVKAAVQVSAGGYDVVLDFAGEARFRVDGGPWQRHGAEDTTGPMVSATTLNLAAGTHTLELRLGTLGGDTELGLMLLPRQSGSPVAFVDPRAAGVVAVPGTVVGPSSLPHPPVNVDANGRVLADYVAAYVADRLGDPDGAEAALARLGGAPRFAFGLALAGAVALNDVTRPANFARDTSQRLLRRAVTLDPSLARAWNALAAIELEDDHPRESLDDARAAIRAAPTWAAPEMTLMSALNARGLELDADQALDRAAAKSASGARATCAVREALLRRANERRDLQARDLFHDQLRGCDALADSEADRLRALGNLPAALAWLRQTAALTPRRDEADAQIAALLQAAGHPDEALAQLRALGDRAPRDVRLRIQLADALTAAGQVGAGRQVLVDLLAAQPSVAEVRQVARAAGLPLPLDPYRVDGAAIISAFRASGRSYAAPSVVVLDRSVGRVFASGEQMMLTHTIVLVQTKEAIDHWGEVAVPANAEILFLRTHKRDGSTRDAEQVSGKDTISAADLAIGDYLEWETLETKPASDAFPGGFLGDRFFFRSFDAPLDRSEYILVTPAGMPLGVDLRAGAPAGVRTGGPDGTVVTRFATGQIPQLFAERSSVPAIEYVPSVRVSSGVTWPAWARFLREQLYGTARSTPAVRQLAASLAHDAGVDPQRRAAAVVAWVTSHIEAADELRDPASATLARGRGNRVGLVLALARELGLPAQVVLARSRLAGDSGAAVSPQELEEFTDALVAFVLPDPVTGARRTIYADVRLRYASFGYLPPNLDGAHTLSVDTAQLGRAEGRGALDQRTVDMTIRLDEEGGAQALATEDLTGWPALEWAELVDRLGADRAKLRQDFEQRWLGVNFPGARLKDLQVDFLSDGGVRPAASSGPSVSRSVRVRYSFYSPNFGLRSDRELKLTPTFFRSQPGRRFAVEPNRNTALMMGYDIPLRMTATVTLPRTAHLIDAPTAAAGDNVVARQGGYRFVEERSSRRDAPDVLILHRESALPIMRVSPEDYGGVAADLRRVDGLEQQEIRIRLPPAHGGTTP